MDMKDVYAALEKLDNGADLITAIKGEINTLNNEAKKNRIAGEHTAEKLKNVLAGLDLEDADDVADKAKNLKAALDTFAQGGKKPTEVAKQITDLTAQVNKVTKQLDAMTKTAQAEKTKRLDSLKMAKAVELLSKVMRRARKTWQNCWRAASSLRTMKASPIMARMEKSALKMV